MLSQYTRTMFVAAPEHLIAQANQLALLVGESGDDDQTFGAADYQDETGARYSVTYTAIKESVIGYFAELPAAALHGKPVDHEFAATAYASIGQPKGLIVILDQTPASAIEIAGLTWVGIAP